MYFEDSDVDDGPPITTSRSYMDQSLRNQTQNTKNWDHDDEEEEDAFNELAYSRGDLFICNCDCICRSTGNPHSQLELHHNGQLAINTAPTLNTHGSMGPALMFAQESARFDPPRTSLANDTHANEWELGEDLDPAAAAAEALEEDSIDDLISIEQIHDDLEILIDVYIFFETMRFMLHGLL